MDRLNASVVGSSNSKCTNDNYYHGGRVAMNKARGPESAGYVTDSSHIRAALIVLITLLDTRLQTSSHAV